MVKYRHKDSSLILKITDNDKVGVIIVYLHAHLICILLFSVSEVQDRPTTRCQKTREVEWYFDTPNGLQGKSVASVVL